MEIACKSFNYSPTRTVCELNNATLSGETKISRDDKNSKDYHPDFNFYMESGLVISRVGHDEL